MKEISEFDSLYKEINANGKKIEQLNFTWELMKTPYIEYHFSLMTNEKTITYFQETLWSRFDEHLDAKTFLINKLENNECIKYHGEIIYCLGKIIDLKNGKQKDKVLEYIIKLSNSNDDTIREKAIIVLGWLGNNNHIEFIGGKLLNDTYNKCRAWSASSFMQIWFKKKNTNYVNKVLPYLYKAIKQEEDVFVIGSIINSFQEMTKNKFIAQKYIDEIDREKIETAKNKLIKYYEKINGIK
jgi:hypothetical protein